VPSFYFPPLRRIANVLLNLNEDQTDLEFAGPPRTSLILPVSPSSPDFLQHSLFDLRQHDRAHQDLAARVVAS